MWDSTNYILIHRKPVSVSHTRSVAWFKRGKRKNLNRVRLTVVDGLVVSTVFLMTDHNFSNYGPPVLFETMIFKDWVALDYQERCCTWREALAMHWRAVNGLKYATLGVNNDG